VEVASTKFILWKGMIEGAFMTVKILLICFEDNLVVKSFLVEVFILA
jgi:hypothetical protein